MSIKKIVQDSIINNDALAGLGQAMKFMNDWRQREHDEYLQTPMGKYPDPANIRLWDNGIAEITVFNGERCDGDWPKETLLGFNKWLAGKIAKIPKQFQPNATIRIDSASGYEDSHYPSIEIKYERPQTPKEKEILRKRAVYESEQKREHDLAKLNCLKKKYPQE